MRNDPPRSAKAERAVSLRPAGATPLAPAPAILRRSAEPSAQPEPRERPVRAVAALPPRPHQPAQAVTIVESDETIRDVARRVYGTAEQAEALWRANRDALPRRDSPLVPGSMLRTPTIR